MLYTLLSFSLQNAVYFIVLTCLVSVLLIFYIQGVLKLKKNNSGAQRLILYREIIAVYSQIQTKHINTLCGQNIYVKLLLLKVNSRF